MAHKSYTPQTLIVLLMAFSALISGYYFVAEVLPEQSQYFAYIIGVGVLVPCVILLGYVQKKRAVRTQFLASIVIFIAGLFAIMSIMSAISNIIALGPVEDSL